jgi:hypothetical protein
LANIFEGTKPAMEKAPKYRRVEMSKHDKRGRRGKHHALIQEIIPELEMLAPSLAMEIPLAKVGGITLANLRSAVYRGSSLRGMVIGTSADEKNLYVWKVGKLKDKAPVK